MSQTILLTNDDGPDSPFWQPIREAFHNAPWCKRLCAVCPDRERSWIGTGFSRFDRIRVTQVTEAPMASYVASGTPSDCVSIGVNNLFPGQIELVISGINVGTNAGSGFLMSSGTVGGALQGYSNGLTAIALSAYVPDEIYEIWRAREFKRFAKFSAEFSSISRIAVDLSEKLLLSKQAEFYSVNLPWGVTPDTEVVFTKVKRTMLPQLFTETSPNEYELRFKGMLEIGTPEDGPWDLDVLRDDKISVSVLSGTVPIV